LHNGSYIFVARKEIIDSEFKKLESTFKWAMKKIKVVGGKW
jgi:RNase P protein component